jgi:hypothetical protein
LTFLDLSTDLNTDLAAHVVLLGSLDSKERTQAADALGRLGKKSRPALPALQLALKDPEADVRLQAVLALEAIGAYDHQPTRTALKVRSENDRSKTVRQAAREALRRLELRALAEGKPIEDKVPPRKTKQKIAVVNGPVVAVFLTQETARHLKHAQLADYLAVQLTSECGFRIVPQDQIKKRLMKEKNKTYKHCYDQRCRIELGKAVAAEKILAVRIFKTGHQCVVTASLYDLRTETTERAATARADCSDADMMSSLDDIARQLSKNHRISRY